VRFLEVVLVISFLVFGFWTLFVVPDVRVSRI
jgi:hypothetical protein